MKKYEPDSEGFRVGDQGVFRRREGHYACQEGFRPGRLYMWRCVEAPAPCGSTGDAWILYRSEGAIHAANTTYFKHHFEIVSDYERIKELLAKCPKPTPRQREEQAFSFAYGNCRLGEIESGRPGKVSRKAFEKLALDRGWTADEFKTWADAHEWDLP